MKLPNSNDNKFLDVIRYKSGYYPFSFKYSSEKNRKLYNQAKLAGASQNVLDIILLGDYFYEKFHLKLTKQLISIDEKISITNDNLKELIVAFLNEQELLINVRENEFFDNTNEMSAFYSHNGAFVRKEQPNNPQNFRGLSEAIIDFGNLLLRYFSSDKRISTQNLNSDLSESKIFDALDKFFEISNRYYIIQNHYDGCLFYNGSINVLNDEKIYFDCCINDLRLYEQISITSIVNQSLNAYQYYDYIAKHDKRFKEWILKNTSNKILSKSLFNKGYVNYELRKRTIEDYTMDLEYFSIIKDHYPFYSSTKMVNLKNLTITDLLHLHTELTNLIRELYLRDFPVKNVNEVKQFKTNFLPKIKHSVLKSYLKSVTFYSEAKIELFIDLLTVKKSVNFNLYETPLLREGNYYYFPYLPLVKRNFLFLIDYWLEQAEEPLDKRGKAFEKYIKEQLQSAERNGYNNFRIIREINFKVDKLKKEEIDLIIETKNTLIVGEIKCVKYPMYERDNYGILRDTIAKAIDQLNRKSSFLIEYQEYFKSLYSLEGKKIIKVIILNFPIFTGAEIEGIPVIDANLFTAYFRSERMVSRSFGNDDNDVEEVDSIYYYTSEEEFCDNFESYLKSPPLVKMYREKLEIGECSYKFDDFPEIYFRDVNPISEEAFLLEKKKG